MINWQLLSRLRNSRVLRYPKKHPCTQKLSNWNLHWATSIHLSYSCHLFREITFQKECHLLTRNSHVALRKPDVSEHISPPFSRQKSKPSKKPSQTGGSAFRLLQLIFCLAYFSTSSETSGSLPSTRRYNPEDHTLPSLRRENLKFNNQFAWYSPTYDWLSYGNSVCIPLVPFILHTPPHPPELAFHTTYRLSWIIMTERLHDSAYAFKDT
jgi:hypothetical protein